MPPLDNSGDNHIPDAVRRSTARAEEVARLAGVANVPAADPPSDESDVSANGETPASGETPPAAPPAAPPVTQQPNEWEQKYRTLQGKYDSEVPGLRSQVNGLQQVLANLEPRSPQQPTKPDPAPSATTVGAPAKDVEEYGQELIDAVRRWARAEVQPLIDELRTKTESLGSNFHQVEVSQRETVVHNAREVCKAELNADPRLGALVAGPDGKEMRLWDKINKDPGYIAWIKQTDPFSGQVRQPLLQGAFDAGQTDRVKAFFNAYLSEHTATQVPAQTPPHTPDGSGTGQRPTLEDFAAPGRGQTTPPPGGAQTEKRTWSQTEIAAFYRDVNRGVYAGREADKLRTEQDIIAAATEGRIK